MAAVVVACGHSSGRRGPGLNICHRQGGWASSPSRRWPGGCSIFQQPVGCPFNVTAGALERSCGCLPRETHRLQCCDVLLSGRRRRGDGCASAILGGLSLGSCCTSKKLLV
uniref:Uncharacterized protein n=1 Tax=Heterosigma akashiwo TaxID=2829 RepID=A0A6T5MI37_HETAK